MRVQRSSVGIAVAFTAFLIACGDGNGGANPGEMDATISGDAPGGDAGEGAGQDSGVACARELLAGSDLGAPDRLIADETHLYLAAYSEEEHRLWQIDRASGEAKLLATLPEIYRARSLVLDAEFVYLSGSSLGEATPVPSALGLYRVSKSGAGQLEQITTDTAESLAIDSTHIYWLTYDGFHHFAIKRRAKAGGKEQVLAEGDTVTSFGPRIALLGEHIYWDLGVELRRVPTAGGSSEVFGILDPKGPPGSCDFCLIEMVAADDGQLYWFNRENAATNFYRTRSDVFQLEPLVVDTEVPASSGFPFFVHEGVLYWPIQGFGIRRAPASGGDAVGVKERNAPAFVPTSDGMYTVNWLDAVRLMPLEGCPE